MTVAGLHYETARAYAVRGSTLVARIRVAAAVSPVVKHALACVAAAANVACAAESAVGAVPDAVARVPDPHSAVLMFAVGRADSYIEMKT